MKQIYDATCDIFASLRDGAQLAYGRYRLRSIKEPIVSVFGSALILEDSEWCKQAYQLGKMLAERNYFVLTGGGTGIMEATACGVREVEKKNGKQRTIGVSVRGLDIGFENKCSEVLWAYNFALRKRLLVEHSAAFIVFPGGIGTLDELLEVLNKQMYGLLPPTPMILVGTEYWQPLVQWYTAAIDTHHLIRDKYRDLFTVVDTGDAAFELIYKTF